MEIIDTHAHLYMEEFDNDRESVIKNAIDNNVSVLLLPNVDSSTIKPMMELVSHFPQNCYPMMGLHPTSVKEDYEKELKIIEDWLKKDKFIAIGEAGIDLYWDKTYINEQIISFERQLDWASELDLPIIVHIRNTFDIPYQSVLKYKNKVKKGIFHCFPGNSEQAKMVIDLGYKIGIGGVVTYKNSGMAKLVEEIGLKNIVLETDSPYLTPAPYRGKRNESAYLKFIISKIAEILETTDNEVAEITSSNAKDLFFKL